MKITMGDVHDLLGMQMKIKRENKIIDIEINPQIAKLLEEFKKDFPHNKGNTFVHYETSKT